MTEGETIAQYSGQVKEGVNSIRGSNGNSDDEYVISKVLRTLLPIYSIKVSTIKE